MKFERTGKLFGYIILGILALCALLLATGNM